METKYQSLSIFEFVSRFQTDRDCLQYLERLKWQDGYQCPKCSNTKYCQGNNEFKRQCTKCRYNESVTAGTLFHKCKFSLVKAFFIVYYVSTSKKGISSTELSRKTNLRQRTSWLFRHKVMKAMESSQQNPLEGAVDVDETKVSRQDFHTTKSEKRNQKRVVIAIEKKGKGISRMYGQVIKSPCRREISRFMNIHICRDATVCTVNKVGYQGLRETFSCIKHLSDEEKKSQFRLMTRAVQLFQVWLRGIHHSVSILQPYINEFSYRFNRHLSKEGLFEELMQRMVQGQPYMYKMFIR